MPKKLTKEEFINRANSIHNNKYDYSKVEYKGSTIKVCIICPIHGEFWQTPNDHINNNHGCPKCANKYITTEEFIEKAKLLHKDKYDYSKVEYVFSNTKVCIICPEHGEFWITPNHHLDGRGCSMCSYLKKNERNKIKAKEKFIKDAKRIYGNKFDYSKVNYITQKDPVEIICPIHGSFWTTPTCFIHNKSNNKYGCPKCGGTYKYTLEEWKIAASIVHCNKYNYDKITEYTGNKQKLCIICPKHGEFWQMAMTHIKGGGCPKCNRRKSQTKFWNKLKESLNLDLEFDYKTEWLGRQSLDIYSIKYNFAVEFNGIQHYEPIKLFGGQLGYINTQKRDNQKIQKCLENNCKLWIVRYDYSEDDYNNLVKEIKEYVNSKEETIS